MQEKDKADLHKQMRLWAEISAGNEQMKEITPIKVELYFSCLKHLTLDQIIDRVEAHFKKNRWFPQPCDFIDDNGEVEATEAYNLIQELMDNFYDPTLGSCCLVAMQERLKDMNKEYINPLLLKWGSEIYERSNPTATRAQFLKAFKTDIKSETEKQLKSKERYKQLKDILSNNKLLVK